MFIIFYYRNSSANISAYLNTTNVNQWFIKGKNPSTGLQQKYFALQKNLSKGQRVNDEDKILINHMPDKGLLSRIYKVFSKLNSKINNPIRKWTWL